MTTRQILDQHRTEIESILRYDLDKSFGYTDEELLAIRRHENLVLIDLLITHKRVMALMAGEPIEPVTHFAESVLLPAGGGGG